MLVTALNDHLAARGAVYAADRGVLLPRRFTDAAAEYTALMHQAALIDLGYRTLVVASGADRTAFLQGMLTNDVARLEPGDACPALLLTIQGRVTADLRVLVLGDRTLLDVDVRAKDALLAALEALIIADDVTLADPDEPLAAIAVDGPRALELLPEAVHDLAPWTHRSATIAGVAVRVLRASEVKGPGAILYAPAPAAPALWDALEGAGARACGMEALESRRLEVGVPRIGLDMGPSTLSLELPVGDAVSDRKGCYLGQEVVARGTARGQVRRTLAPLLLDLPAEGRLPEPGAVVRDGSKAVGHLTTVGRAFGLGGRPAALAMLRREHAAPGHELLVVGDAGNVRARAMTWPLA